jgi:hypothetical protein
MADGQLCWSRTNRCVCACACDLRHQPTRLAHRCLRSHAHAQTQHLVLHQHADQRGSFKVQSVSCSFKLCMVLQIRPGWLVLLTESARPRYSPRRQMTLSPAVAGPAALLRVSQRTPGQHMQSSCLLSLSAYGRCWTAQTSHTACHGAASNQATQQMSLGMQSTETPLLYVETAGDATLLREAGPCCSTCSLQAMWSQTCLVHTDSVCKPVTDLP